MPHRVRTRTSLSLFQLKLRLVLGVFLLNVVVAVLAAYSLYRDRSQFEERTTIAAQNMAELLGHDIGAVFDRIDLTLRSIVEEAEGQIAAGGINEARINKFLMKRQSVFADGIVFRVVDSQGYMRYGDKIRPENLVDANIREHYVRQKYSATAGLVIARPIMGRVRNEWVIPLSRRINRPDGSFAGVVLGSIPTKHLTKQFSSINIGPYGIVALRNMDYVMMARYPQADSGDASTGRTLVSSELRAMLEDNLMQGSFRVVSPLDDIERTYAFSRLHTYPAFVLVGLADQDYLKDWRRNAGIVLLLASVFVLTSVALAVVVFRAWKRQWVFGEALKSSQEHLRHLALHDGLTGLPNRTLLNERLSQNLLKAQRNKTRMALLYFDLDRFKPVNDLHGHEVGDLLLKAVAGRTLDCLRASDTLVRLGGDEFVVILPTIDTTEHAVMVAEKIRHAMAQPFDIGGQTFNISCSIGVATYPDQATKAQQLMHGADAAMYQAKKRGRNQVVLYQKEIPGA